MSRLAQIDEHDKNMIRHTWKLLSPNIQKIALDIFEMIFEQCPEAKLVRFIFDTVAYPKNPDTTILGELTTPFLFHFPCHSCFHTEHSSRRTLQIVTKKSL